MDPSLHRKNIRVAWMLGGLILAIMGSSVFFWKGMAKLIAQMVKG